MCFICDGGTIAELHRWVDDAIEQVGLFVTGVEDDADTVGWAYTIGLTERFGHPELVTVGMGCFHCSGKLLNALGRRISLGERFDVDDVVFAQGIPVARFGEVHADEWATDRFNGWWEHYDSKPWDPPPSTALQVIWRDREEGFQDEAWNARWPEDCLSLAPSSRPGAQVRRSSRPNRRERRERGRRRGQRHH